MKLTLLVVGPSTPYSGQNFKHPKSYDLKRQRTNNLVQFQFTKKKNKKKTKTKTKKTKKPRLRGRKAVSDSGGTDPPGRLFLVSNTMQCTQAEKSCLNFQKHFDIFLKCSSEILAN